jgi:hypothetical protein
VSTPYRTDLDALQQRKTSLEGELARLREQTTGLDQLRAREGELARELAGVEGRLAAGGATRRPLPMLDQVRVASPCKADWNEMLGDDRVRFCLGCEKNVYNLSSMAREDAEALLRARMGNELCVRFFQRQDGTILTQDCPVGVKKKQRKKLALAVAGAGVMAAAAATMFMKTTCRQGGAIPVASAAPIDPTPMMGEPAMDPPPPAPEPTPPPQEVKGQRVTMGAAFAPAPMPKPKKPTGRR